MILFSGKKSNDTESAPAGRGRSGLRALLLFLALCGALLAGCGRKAESEEVIVKPDGEDHPVAVEEERPSALEEDGASVCLVVPSAEGPFATEIRILTEAAAEAGASVTVLNYMNDPIAEAGAMEQAVRDGAALIICDNIDETQTLRGIRSAKKKNIPVFLIGRGIEPMGMASHQVLTERYTCVRKMGEEYAERKKKGAAYVLMRTEGAEDDLAEAFSAVLAGRTGFQELESASCDGQNAEEAYDAAWNLLHDHPNADTIVCVSAAQTKAAVDASADLGLAPSVLCLADDTDEIVQYVEEGKVHAAIVRPAGELAERAAVSLKEYLETGELPGTECYYVQGEIRISDGAEGA